MKPKMRLKYLHEISSVKEEWSTESPGTGGEMANILPETVIQTLVPNFLTARPPVGNLTVEDAAEFILITAEQKCLTEDDYKFIKQANDAPHEVFYRWLVLRGYRPSMAQLRGWWESEPNIKLISKLKNTYKRERPFVKFPEVHLAPGVSANDYSFPSRHACGSFYIATKLSEIYPHLADQLFGLADRIANTRVQAGVHYPSDVQAGRAIGIALAKLSE